MEELKVEETEEIPETVAPLAQAEEKTEAEATVEAQPLSRRPLPRKKEVKVFTKQPEVKRFFAPKRPAGRKDKYQSRDSQRQGRSPLRPVP